MCDFTAVPIDQDGIVDPAAVAAAVIPGRTVLVAVMHSSNEVGSVQPIAEIAAAAREAASTAGGTSAPLRVHTDAAQSYGNVRVDAEALGVGMITVVGHKFGAPKGIAALDVRRGEVLEPLLHGADRDTGNAQAPSASLCVRRWGPQRM